MAGLSQINPYINITPEPAPSEANFYTLIGKPKSGNPPGILWKFSNARRAYDTVIAYSVPSVKCLKDRLRGAAI